VAGYGHLDHARGIEYFTCFKLVRFRCRARDLRALLGVEIARLIANLLICLKCLSGIRLAYQTGEIGKRNWLNGFILLL
jgi:hypothetical protein